MARARLLIVGDDPELRPFLRIELEIESYICAEAASGQQALALIRANAGGLQPHPDCPRVRWVSPLSARLSVRLWVCSLQGRR